jgi:hypothetical protein
MAEYADSAESKLIVKDTGAHPFGFIEIGEGGTTHFTCLVLDVSGVSYYYWPNSSGVLRYGTTEPTTSTQDTAGSVV